MDQARRAIGEWKSLREFVLGELGWLLPITVLPFDWCAWQFHREDLQAGFAMFFRRHKSLFSLSEIPVKRIDPGRDYEIGLSAGYNESPRMRVSGRDLLPLHATIPEAPGSVLVRYRIAE